MKNLVQRTCLLILLIAGLRYGLTPQPTFARELRFDKPITQGDTNAEHPRVALIFDACQTARHTAGFDRAILDVLQRTQTPATVFLGGLWMQSHISATQALAASPWIELANHSWSHLDFTKISSTTMQTELVKTQNEMMDMVGRKPTLFRFPYGRFNDAALRVVRANGLIPVQWDVVSGDPSRGNSAKRLLARVISNAHDGSIIIMHINGRGWHSAEALPQIIATLKAQGFAFVTVSDLLHP